MSTLYFSAYKSQNLVLLLKKINAENVPVNNYHLNVYSSTLKLVST